jgi:autophagy-related protein 2
VDGVEVGLRYIKAKENVVPESLSDSIINTKEVAKEFLATEPAEEIHELEEAIHAQPAENLEESNYYDDSSEEGEETGMGGDVALPGFIAGWLTGIANRSEVSIRNVVFAFNFDLPAEEFGISRDESLESSLRFYVEELEIEGLTTMKQSEDDEQDPAWKASSRSKRRLLCRKMRADLTTTSAFFASLSRVPSMQTNTESQPVSPERSSKGKSPLSARSATTSPRPKSKRRMEDSISSGGLEDSQVFGMASMMHSNMSEDMEDSIHNPPPSLPEDDRYADASDDGHGEDEDEGFPTHSAFGFHNRFEDSEEDTSHVPFPMDMEASEAPSSNGSSRGSGSQMPSIGSLARRTDTKCPVEPPKTQLSMSQLPSIASLSRRSDSSSAARPSSSKPLQSSFTRSGGTFGLPLRKAPSYKSDSPESDSSSDLGDDLSESKLFTHEEAESMYQSAFSEIARSVRGRFTQDPDSDDEHLAYGTGVEIPPPVDETRERIDDTHMATPKVTSPLDDLDSPRTPKRGDFQLSQPESSSTRLTTKTVLFLDRLAVRVPWMGNYHPAESETDSDTLSDSHTDSSMHAMPGAFSYHEKEHRQHKSKSSEKRKPAESSVKDEEESPEVEIYLGFLESQFDLSTGRLLYLLFQQVTEATKEASSGSSTPVPQTPKQQSLPEPKDFSVLFKLEKLQTKIQQSLRDDFGWGPEPMAISTEPLLVLDVSGCQAQYKQIEGVESAKVMVDTFSLGLPNEKLISFDQTIPSREASQVLPLPHDIQIKYKKDFARGPEVLVETRRLILSLNMQKLDERLECYGGLSAILDLSASIASNGTTLPQPQIKSTLSSPISTRAPPDELSSLKLNAHVSGVMVRVRGREYGVELQSTALRVIARQNAISATVSHIQVYGPVTSAMKNPAHAEGLVRVEVTKARFSFMFTPDEADIDSLISLIMPSRDPYDEKDDILVDTLIRQRKHGSVLRGTIENIDVQVPTLTAVDKFQELGQELAKLGNVAKYLPEDDRPGVMILVTSREINMSVEVNRNIGPLELEVREARLAHVGLPQLSAFSVQSLALLRYGEQLVHPLLPMLEGDELPMLMGKFIPDEMEPTAKLKVFNLAVEYDVKTLMECMGATTHITREDLTQSMVASVSTIRGAMANPLIDRNQSWSDTSKPGKPLRLNVLIRDCAALLNPENQTSKGVFLLGEAVLAANMTPKDNTKIQLQLRSAFLLAIDDADQLNTEIQPASRRPTLRQKDLAQTDLTNQGYKLLGMLKQIMINVKLEENHGGSPMVEIIVNSHVVHLETCADSTQTLIQMIDGLKPPTSPDPTPRYQMEPMQPEELMKAFTGSNFEQDELEFPPHSSQEINLDEDDELGELSDEFEMIGSFYDPGEGSDEDEPRVSHISNRRSTITDELPPSATLPFSGRSRLQFRHGTDATTGQTSSLSKDRTVYGWNSISNRYGNIPDVKVKECPLRLEVHSETFMWNLFDGYDWQKTRNIISDAVDTLQEKAAERRINRQKISFDDDEEESEIGDFLFQSIWISVNPNKEENDLRRRINHDMDGGASESGTVTTTFSQATSRATGHRRRGRTLKLERSSRHKVSIEVRNLKAEILGLPPNASETQSSVNVHVGDFEIFDHVPTSTWRKFVTYQHDAGTRPVDRPMIHLDLQTVKPKSELAATEMVIKVTLLPLRLHVDQDTLDFITRFFEFKNADDQEPKPKPVDPPFIQRCEIKSVDLKLDYKPKKVDYLGLRSGKTKEFMNFVGLDATDITLRRIILYGISGLDRLHTDLNDLWVGDVIRNQLPIVLQGLAPMRPLFNVGSGIRQLVMVPLEEYRKDGRVVRSIRKGASAFARTTTSEIARLGAKVAIGTGNLLEGASNLLSADSALAHGDDYYTDEEGHYRRRRTRASPHTRSPSTGSTRAVSQYANQPLTVSAGLRSATRVLERDLATAHNTIIAIGTEVRESETAGQFVGAVMRSAPAVILRPAVGASRALGHVLMGAGNALDPDSRRKVEDVS